MVGIRLHIFLLAINLSLVLGGIFDPIKYDIDKGVHVIKRGERQPGDEKLFHELLNEKGQQFPPKHAGNKYCYPPQSSMQSIKITSYEVKDLDTGNDGGVAFDVSGGVDQSQVCVFLKSQFYAGSYHYEIDVYGYKLDSNGQMIRNNMGGNNMGGMGVGNMGDIRFGNVGGFGANNYPPAGGYGGGFGNNNLGGYNNNGFNGYGSSGSGYGSSSTGYYGSGSYAQGYNSHPLDQGTNRYSPGNERY